MNVLLLIFKFARITMVIIGEIGKMSKMAFNYYYIFGFY